MKTEDVFDSNHWRVFNYRQRVTRKEAQNILINHPTIIFQGTLYNIKVKHIGAGVYEIFKEEKQYNHAKN